MGLRNWLNCSGEESRDNSEVCEEPSSSQKLGRADCRSMTHKNRKDGFGIGAGGKNRCCVSTSTSTLSWVLFEALLLRVQARLVFNLSEGWNQILELRTSLEFTFHILFMHLNWRHPFSKNIWNMITATQLYLVRSRTVYMCVFKVYIPVSIPGI